MKINRKYINIKVLYVFFALFIGLLSCDKGIEEDVLFTGDNYENIMQYIDANPDFSSFKEIVVSAKMTDVLRAYNSNGGNNYTLFLPTNEAVAEFINENFSYDTFDALLQDVGYCAEIVRYHLVNGEIPSTDFPNGSLTNRTISNFYLTIIFREENNLITFSVNDEAKVLTTDIVLANGIIHSIDRMLTPVVFTSYQWVQQHTDFTIFSELLDKCGLADTLNAFVLDEFGREVYNEYTLFAESDALFEANSIMSCNDLVDSLGSEGKDFTNPNNVVNKYARYHILEKSVFLDAFATDVYNTYGDFPISVDIGENFKINMGSQVFNIFINNGDTVIVDYLQVDLDKSNIVTRSGAIHQLDHLLYPFRPGRKTVTLQFHEEPMINALRETEGTFYIDQEDLDYISFVGTNYLLYTKSQSDIPGVFDNDYIQVSGDVDFVYQTPKILAGRYQLRLIMQRGYNNLASFQAYVDDMKVGVVVDATKAIGFQSAGFNTNNDGSIVGIVEFSDFSSHKVKLSTVIPGHMYIDRIIFQPIN